MCHAKIAKNGPPGPISVGKNGPPLTIVFPHGGPFMLLKIVPRTIYVANQVAPPSLANPDFQVHL